MQRFDCIVIGGGIVGLSVCLGDPYLSCARPELSLPWSPLYSHDRRQCSRGTERCAKPEKGRLPPDILRFAGFRRHNELSRVLAVGRKAQVRGQKSEVRDQVFSICRFALPAFAPIGLPLAGYLQRSRACGSAFQRFEFSAFPLGVSESSVRNLDFLISDR